LVYAGQDKRKAARSEIFRCHSFWKFRSEQSSSRVNSDVVYSDSLTSHADKRSQGLYVLIMK